MNLIADIESLYARAFDCWELVRENYTALSHMRLKRLVHNGREHVVQFNPCRYHSAVAGADTAPRREQECFLCTEHQPAEQESILWKNRYKIQINPYPIFNRHLTLSLIEHRPQCIVPYIDDMMAHLGADYLVGWLTAAERHGAGHHAAQVFQVATGKAVRARTFGRSRLEFYTRGYVGAATQSAELLRKTGVRVASPGTTMLMLAADPGICGGMSNVVNLVVELAEEHPGFEAEAAADAPLFPDAAARRLGWLLDAFGVGAPDEITSYCASLTSEPSFLSSASARTGKLDAKWRIIVNEKVDPDI